MKPGCRFAATSVACGFVLSATAAFGAPITFTIDGTQSYMSVSIETASGIPFTTSQFSGSNTSRISGTQNVNIGGGSIQFLSTGNIQFSNQPLPVSPAVGGVFPGSGSGQFGLLAAIPGMLGGPGPGGTGLLAFRGLVADGTSGPIPLTGNAFDASQIATTFQAGVIDLNLLVFGIPIATSFNLPTNPANNQLTGGTLTSSGGLYTLAVPFRTKFDYRVNGIDIRAIYSGQVVATASVPEPSCVFLASLATVGFVVSLLRRHRNLDRCVSDAG